MLRRSVLFASVAVASMPALAAPAASSTVPAADMARWQAQAAHVSI